jgi:purine-binding chemotaxis protein CheW
VTQAQGILTGTVVQCRDSGGPELPLGRAEPTFTMDEPRANPALLARVPGALCALPLAQVIETMRPLPIEPLASQSNFILGVARIRGAAVPVVGLTALFQGDRSGWDQSCELPARFVTLRVGQRCVALAVHSVVGIVDLGYKVFGELPPLLSSLGTEPIQTLGTLDAEFLVVLDMARLVPDSAWEALSQTKAAP